MKILYVCADPGIPIRGHKGAAVHVRALVNAFTDLGHEVTLVSPRGGPVDGPAPVARFIEVAGPPSPSRDALSSEREHWARRLADEVYQVAARLLNDTTYDLMYERYSLWSDAGARLVQDYAVPLVVEVNAPLRIEAARFRALHDAQRAHEIETRMFRAAHQIAVVSGPLRSYVVETGVDSVKVQVISNAVDEHLFHPAVPGDTVRSALGLDDKIVVGFAGTVKPWHDLDTLLAAFKLLAGHDLRLRLLLVGDIPEATRIAVEQHGLAHLTKIVGPFPHSEVPKYLAAMDIAVSPHPPLDDFYFSPLKLFEYLACGVATVAADVPPVAELFADEQSLLLYQPGNATDLARRISRLATDPAERTHLAWHGATQTLRRHTWRHNAQRVLGTFVPQSELDVKKDAGALFDERLRRRLYRATRADVAGSLLAQHLNGAGASGRVTRLDILKYKPGRRCVIGYELMVDRGPGEPEQPACRVIGKVFRDERGLQHFKLHQALWDAGFATEAEDGVTIAAPYAYIPEMRMFLQEYAPGETLDHFLLDPVFPNYVQRSAEVIAKLHACSIEPKASYELATELNNLERWAADLAAWRPEHAGAFTQQLGWLRAQATTLPAAVPAPSHRDFYYSQVLFAGDRTTLIDLDMFAWADPAIDIANFAAHLQFLALQHLHQSATVDALVELFVRTYSDLRSPDAGFSERLAWYEAATFFRLMHVAHQRPILAHCFDALFARMEQLVVEDVEVLYDTARTERR